VAKIALTDKIMFPMLSRKVLHKKAGDMIAIGKHDALLVVDVQNDFMPGGTLAIVGGDQVVPVINRISGYFETRVFTRDWHPADHISFSNKPQFVDKSWPSHCVQNTWGAQFHPDLKICSDDLIVSKGDNSQLENYSCFHETDMEEWLLRCGIHRICIAGLATDYCVFTTAMDGLRAGFEVWVFEDAIAGVDVPSGSVAKALQTLLENGVHIISTGDLSLYRTMVSSTQYSPTMTKDYSQISDTARMVDAEVLPRMASYIRRISPHIAAMSTDEVFVIADYGAADGVNSSELFEAVIRRIHEVNPMLTIKLVYIDLADPENFEAFWATSALAKIEHVECQYIQRSFYEPFPEITGKLRIGFSSTALHWMNAKTVGPDYFQHPLCIQPNQLPDSERREFAEKWKADWRSFLHECSTSLVEGGALFLANLTNLGDNLWPASPGYNNLRDICRELCEGEKISEAELNAIFIPDYFATPYEMSCLLDEDDLSRRYAVNACDSLTVPCAYFAKMQDKLDDLQERSRLADTLARVVRAWSESSMQIGLRADNKGLIEDIYRRLRDRFYEIPEGLPYQYCLLELIKKHEERI